MFVCKYTIPWNEPWIINNKKADEIPISSSGTSCNNQNNTLNTTISSNINNNNNQNEYVRINNSNNNNDNNNKVVISKPENVEYEDNHQEPRQQQQANVNDLNAMRLGVDDPQRPNTGNTNKIDCVEQSGIWPNNQKLNNRLMNTSYIISSSHTPTSVQSSSMSQNSPNSPYSPKMTNLNTWSKKASEKDAKKHGEDPVGTVVHYYESDGYEDKGTHVTSLHSSFRPNNLDNKFFTKSGILYS